MAWARTLKVMEPPKSSTPLWHHLTWTFLQVSSPRRLHLFNRLGLLPTPTPKALRCRSSPSLYRKGAGELPRPFGGGGLIWGDPAEDLLESQTMIQIPAIPLLSWVTLGQLLDLSEPPVLLGTYLAFVIVVGMSMCLAHTRCSMDAAAIIILHGAGAGPRARSQAYI